MNDEKFFEIREKMKDREYMSINEYGSRVLVVRSPNRYPDIVNDVERLVERIKINDAKALTDVYLIGEKEIVNVQPKIIEVLVRNRKEYDDKIVEKMRNQLSVNESTIFTDKNDVYKLCRFAFRIPGEIDEYSVFIKKIQMPPEDVSIIYLIGNDDYVRIMADDFVKLLRSKEECIGRMKEKFISSGYEIINLDGVDVAALKGNQRMVVTYFDRCSVEDVENMLNIVEHLRADVGLVISVNFPKEVKRFAMGKKIELIKTDEIGDLFL
ncbi:MAG: hypothetical protein KKE04_00885 [Candidatus Thermoplasmatota archaeon]|nr:hypothetical protein [Candidatus Thermoplasmatota archaeon]